MEVGSSIVVRMAGLGLGGFCWHNFEHNRSYEHLSIMRA